MSDKTFAVKYLSPTAIKPYFRNHKMHSKAQITKLAKAIGSMGFDQPIVVDKDYIIIKGHGRRMAALELKLDLVPVVVRDDLTPDEVQAARIADNHSHTMSSVDLAKEQSEIASYMAMGGKDAPIYFDFLREGKDKLDVPGAAGTNNKGTTVAGKLLSCPKCHHTFMKA